MTCFDSCVHLHCWRSLGDLKAAAGMKVDERPDKLGTFLIRLPALTTVHLYRWRSLEILKVLAGIEVDNRQEGILTKGVS